jgi:Spy/CpxP family protein refolding chaperone
MRTNHKKLGLTVALFATMVFALFTSPANAQGRGCCMDRMSGYDGGWSNASVPQQYQLSAEQMTRVRDIRSQNDDMIIPLQRELRALRMEVRGYAARPDAETGKIKSYRKDINNLEDKIQDLRLDARAEIQKTLAKEQRAYFGNSYDWWDMDGGMMMGNMMDDMGMHDDCSMMSDRWGW